MHSFRYIKQYALKIGIYSSIIISILILFTLLTTLVFKGSDALQNQYLHVVELKNQHPASEENIKKSLKRTLHTNNIFNYNSESFNIKKSFTSNNQTFVLINNSIIKNDILKKLKKNNLVKNKWNLSFFKSNDSTQSEKAGIFNSLVGSIFTLLICMLFSIPLGVGTAIYLEEFAPKNNITSFIEINIKNLAAIPSVVYGLLGLVLFIKVMHINRSSSLVGGLTLAMMSIPIIMIVTQQALRSVPYRIREGALAMGTSKVQLLLKFILPISFPSILTGIVLSVSRVIGETAPLIIVGMTAFVTKAPSNFFDPTTTLPTQIYLWSDNVDKLFIAKSCLAILFLLFFLFMINFISLYFKSKKLNNV